MFKFQNPLKNKNMENQTDIQAKAQEESMECFLERIGAIKLAKSAEEFYRLKKSDIKTPIGLFFQNIFTDYNAVNRIAKSIVDDIQKAGEKFENIASYGYDGIPIAYEVWRQLGDKSIRFTPIQTNKNGRIEGFYKVKELDKKKTIIIAGIIATGKNLQDSISMINDAGSTVITTYAFFDFQFTITSPRSTGEGKNKVEKIKSIVNPETLINSKINKSELLNLNLWKLSNKNLFTA
jgi:orotate phosphoribosyltransferase